jgi:hypothetical protein
MHSLKFVATILNNDLPSIAARSPTDATIDLARRVIDGSVADPTGGAEKFDNPTLQDLLAKALPYDEQTKKGYRTSDEILAKRTLEGYTAVAIEGTSTRFWVKS